MSEGRPRSAVYLVEGLVAFLVALVLVSWAVGRVQSWLEAREQERLERQRQLLEESWRVYQASRAIYDQTAAALQEMLSAQRDRGRRP